MFAKNRPTKRIELPEGHWAELRQLSKGEKDAYRSGVSGVFKGALKEKNGQKEQDFSNLPDDYFQKMQQAEYAMVAKAIVSWSAEGIEVTPQAVADLEESFYDPILEAVKDMNELTKTEVKN